MAVGSRQGTLANGEGVPTFVPNPEKSWKVKGVQLPDEMGKAFIAGLKVL